MEKETLKQVIELLGIPENEELKDVEIVVTEDE